MKAQYWRSISWGQTIAVLVCVGLRIEYSTAQSGDCINVKNVGAKGDGTSKDKWAIQKALDSAQIRCVFFPKGIYNISDSTVDVGSSRTLLFESDSSILKYTGNGSAVKIGNEKFVTWHRGRIDVTGAGNNAVGLHIKGLWNSDFYGIQVDRKSTTYAQGNSQVGVKIETRDGGAIEWGSYVINFYKPVLTVGKGLAAFQTMRTPGDAVNITQVTIVGGWMTGGADIFSLKHISGSIFENVASESTDGDVFDIDSSHDLIIFPGELPASLPQNSYHFNCGTNTSAISIITQGLSSSPSLVINGNRPAIFSRSSVELYGSRDDQTFYARLISQYNYNQVLKLTGKGGGSEYTLLEWGEGVGLTIRGGDPGITIGDGSTPIKKHMSATLTWDPASVANNSFTSTTVPVSGASVGETAVVGFSQSVPAGVTLFGAVTSANTATVTLHNFSGSTVDLASGTLRVDVWKH